MQFIEQVFHLKQKMAQIAEHSCFRAVTVVKPAGHLPAGDLVNADDHTVLGSDIYL